MTRFGPVFLAAALAVGSVGLVPGRAQAQAASNQIDIPHHIANSHEVETPFGVWHLPRWEPIHLGGLSIDMSPTKHLVYMLLAAALVALVFVPSARVIQAAQARGRPSKGFAGAMEATALYIRQEVILPNVGHHGDGYVPYLLTLFFVTLAWVLFCATTFLRAGHNFIRGGEMSPARFGLVLLRFVGGQVAMLVRSLGVHISKRLNRPKPIVFDRTPKKGA